MRINVNTEQYSKEIQNLAESFSSGNDFLDHIDKCPECREELTIQFLVRTGMQRLEDGNTFNLKEELDNLLKSAEKRLKGRRRLVRFSFLLEALVLALAVMTVVLAFAIG